MIQKVLTAFPKLTSAYSTTKEAEAWDAVQKTDLNQMWLDIKAVLDTMRRSTGITGAVATGSVISHTLGVVPSFVLITATDATPTNIYASVLTSTSFTLNYTGGGTHIFGWSAEL